jgi:uncharacterized Zn finger protein
MSWDEWEPWGAFTRRPRLQADGIRARTQRGKFGQSWWAGRWIAALERICNEGRLSRGRSYARSGQVLKLEVGSKGVAAEVLGNRPKPYKVTIHFRALSDAEWERVIDALARQALYAAKLLSGEMPETIEQVFAAADTTLLPASESDLTTDCSCPDWSNPCKHVAAVYYLLGERFDDDPFLMFSLRGRSKEQLLSALRTARGSAAVDPSEVAPEGVGYEAAAPLPKEPAAFWSRTPVGASLNLAFEEPAVHALAVKCLGPAPFPADAAELEAQMEQLYATISRHARAVAMGAE